MNIRDVSQYLRPLVSRVGNMIASAVITSVDDGTKMQSVQIQLAEGEIRGGVERPQPYGFSAHPLVGAEATVVCVGGRRDHCVVVAADDRRYRLKGLAQGEVALYTDEGDKIVLGRGGTITITASSKVVVNAPLVEVPSGDVTAGGKSLRNHTHSAGELLKDGQGLLCIGTTGAPT